MHSKLLSASTLALGASLALLAGSATAQVSYSENWDVGVGGWTGNFSRFTGTTACGGSGGAMRRNLWASATTGQLISPLTGTSLGGVTTIDYNYKAMNWSANTIAAPVPWGSFDVQYGPSATGPWTTIATVSDETQTSGVCLAKSHTFSPPAGPLYIRFNATWTAGDYFLNFDDVVINETVTPCSGVPAPGDVTGPSVVCVGESALLGLQNPTTGSGVSYQWFESTVGPLGPWLPLGTASTQLVSPVVTTWYYCSVTCATGPDTGNSNVKQIDIGAAWPQGWESGVITANCWTNTGGTVMPMLGFVSAFGVGSHAARFNFYSWTSPNSAILTSPVFTPTSPGDRVYFDVAGTQYSLDLTFIDVISLEESNDGGTTWNVIDVMNNAANGKLRTAAPVSGAFVPTAGQWASLDFPLSAGTNRIRFNAASGYGNDVYIDNVSVGVLPSARHTVFGSSCVAGFNAGASPAPVTGSTFAYNLAGIPETSTGSGIYLGVVALTLVPNYPGTSILGYTFGAIDSPCNMHAGLNVVDIVDLRTFVGGPANSGVTFFVPLAAPLGAIVYGQAIALTDLPAGAPGGMVTSNAVRSFVNNF